LEENITDVETGIGLQCELGQEVLRNISHFIKDEELDMSDEEKFDCEFEALSDDELDSDSSADSENPPSNCETGSKNNNNTIYLVPFAMLRCFDCGSTFKLQKTCSRGSMLLATFLCQNNNSLTWKSQSTENYYSSGNVQLSAAMYLCGLNFSKFETLCKTAGIQLFSNHTYYRIIKNLAIPCIKHTWNVQKKCTVGKYKI
jgi:hypothetical protein